MNPKYKIGSWVRFYSSGNLIIGVVQYIQKDVIGKFEYQTDQGCVDESSILEAR